MIVMEEEKYYVQIVKDMDLQIAHLVMVRGVIECIDNKLLEENARIVQLQGRLFVENVQEEVV